MAQAIRLCLITALWYGGLAALLIYGVTPFLHREGWLLLKDNASLTSYQKRATGCAAIGYPLICATLIAGSAHRRKVTRTPATPV